MTTQHKFDNAVLECYRELYANSTGLNGEVGDFDKLVESATINDKGRKVIPCDDYYIPKDKYNEIVDKHKKGLPKTLRYSFSVSINLGCSPNTCKKNWEK